MVMNVYNNMGIGVDIMTIAEVAKRFKLTTDTLRYYEKVGLVPRVQRSANGIRNYDEEDCNWVEFIKCMRDSGLSIATLVRYVKLFQDGDETRGERKSLLIEERQKLTMRMKDMQATLDRLNKKIERYESGVVEAENELRK